MKKMMLVVLAGLMLAGPAMAAENLWELRNKSNATQAFVDANKELWGVNVATSIAPQGITNAMIENGAVDTGKLATDSVTGVKILNGTIGAEKLNFSPGASFPLLAPNGTGGAPSYSFASFTNTGVWYESISSQLSFGIGGTTKLGIKTAEVNVTQPFKAQAVGAGIYSVIASSGVEVLDGGYTFADGTVQYSAKNTSGTITGTGTPNKVAKFSGSGTNLSNSSLTDNGSSVTSSVDFDTLANKATVNGLEILGAMAVGPIRNAACNSSQCLVFNTSDFDLYTSTGSGVGQWRNTRTGVGP